MAARHGIGISSFAYSYACGSKSFMKPECTMTARDLIDRAVSAGADVVQFGDNMPLEKYTGAELDEIRAYAETHGIELEAGMRKATPERLSAYIKITNRIGARILRLITDGKDYEPSFEECCENFRSVIPELERSGVTLAIENHDRFHAYEYAEMIRRVGHPQIGLTIDSVNSLSIEEPVGEVLKHMSPYCVCLHMKDYVIVRTNGGGGLKITGTCPGTGRLDIDRCIKECDRQSGNNFNIIIESWMEPCETIEETLKQEDEWARAGVKYLKELLGEQ